MSGPKHSKKSSLETIYFVSLGCPKNRVDSEVMAGVALEGGLALVGEPDKADVIVVNTCGFIGDAKEESINTLLEMAQYKNSGRCSMLIAAGCLCQLYSDDLADALPELDKIIGTDRPDQLMKFLTSNANRIEVGSPGHFLQHPKTPRFLNPDAASAYVKISDGCSRKCAFCIIPQIRGAASSRPVKDIVAEVKKMTSVGVREINLVAQDTSAYGRDLNNKTDLVTLIRELDKVDGLCWMRLLYLYPDTIPDEIFYAMRDLKTLVPYLDMPIQHSSPTMLKHMHRGHGTSVLKDLIDRARSIVPGIFLRTTALVGFPGETQKDVDHLVEFIKQAKFNHLGVFRYSDVEGTFSYKKEPQVSKRDSYNRWRKIMATQRKIAAKNARDMIGQTVEVLVESTADDQGFVLQGRHSGQAPEIDGVTYLVSCTASPGDIVAARIIDSKIHDLVAEPM